MKITPCALHAIAVVISTLAPIGVQAATVIAGSDTYVTEHPSHGGSSSTHGSDTQLSAIGLTGFRSNPLVAFDLSSFSGQTVSGDGTFRFYLAAHSAGPFAEFVNVHRILQSWSPATATYSGFNPTEGLSHGSFLDSIQVQTNLQYWEWTIPQSVIQDWIDNPGTNFGLLVNNTQAGIGNRDFHFASMEAADGFRPELVFTAVPEPSTAGLILGGGAFAIIMGRRRKSEN